MNNKKMFRCKKGVYEYTKVYILIHLQRCIDRYVKKKWQLPTTQAMARSANGQNTRACLSGFSTSLRGGVHDCGLRRIRSWHN